MGASDEGCRGSAAQAQEVASPGGLSGTEYMQDVCAGVGWGSGVGGFGGGGNTPRTRGPLLRCGGHGRRCHGPDAAHALAFRLTGVGEDVGHTV